MIRAIIAFVTRSGAISLPLPTATARNMLTPLSGEAGHTRGCDRTGGMITTPLTMLTDLSTTPIAETLRRLAVDRRSGDLQIRTGKLVKIASFDHGRLVFAASNLKKDRLGEALLALGRITDEEFTRVSALMKGDRKRRFGEALIAAGVMDKNELGTSVARQVRRIVLSLFESQEGAAAFEERPCVIPLDYMVSLSVPRILFEGIRLMASRELILAGLGELDRPVVLAAGSPFRFSIEECTPEEVEILELARRKVTLRRLAWATGGLAFSRLRAVYALTASGVVVPADAGVVPQPIVQLETGTFLLSALQRQPDPSGVTAIRREVQDELERSARLDREAWLKVTRTAPREELIRALEDKMERYHALRDAVGDEEQIKTDIEVILGRASAMLRLARQAPPPETRPVPPPPPSGQAAEPLAELPLEELTEASEPATPASSPEPTESPRSPDEPLSSPPSDASAEAAPAPRRRTLEEGGTGVGVSNFEGRAQIEHLMMEAEVRMTVSDYANAIKVYERLVELAPKVGAFRARLAIAMACYPRTSKHAERQFMEALRLDPDNADIHYQFGLYYKAMKQRQRAVAEMGTAVRLNPRHKAARQELETLSPKDSALTSLKKLFS
jgi:tetratricopeptide (TPR) repeat protein